MFVTNTIILAVELKMMLDDLFGISCSVELLNEKAAVVNFSSKFEPGVYSGCIECTCADDGACVVKITTRMTMLYSQMVEEMFSEEPGVRIIGRDDDTIIAEKEHTMSVDGFSNLSTRQTVPTAKDIAKYCTEGHVRLDID